MPMTLAMRTGQTERIVEPDLRTAALRAAGDPPQAAATLRTEILTLADLVARRAAWQDLAGRAWSPNVFLEPDFAEPAATHLGGSVRFVAVTAAPDRLVGLFPMMLQPWRYGGLLQVLSGWTHAYAPLWLPLLEERFAAQAIDLWLDLIGSGRLGSRIIRLPFLPVEDPVARMIDTAIGRRGWPQATLNSHRRASLDTARAGHDPASPRKRKELARQWRRLQERGTLTSRTATAPDEVARTFAIHVGLEFIGWKGRYGTSFLNLPRHRDFADRAIRGLAARGQCRVDVIELDGRAIVTGVTLTSQDRAWYWKTAYDEAWRRYSPGVQLTLGLGQALARETGTALVDSCARPDHPMIDGLWHDRIEMADLLFAAGPAGRLLHPVALRLEAWRAAAVARLRRRNTQERPA
jgi:CelD/BcsL family acetyltransferase involved in cellulose biosynthesis